jgi:hypothetical protein
MLELFILLVYIAALQWALAFSKKLKPRTWVYLALTQGLLAAFCFWGYYQALRYEMPIAEQSASLVLYRDIDATWSSEPTKRIALVSGDCPEPAVLYFGSARSRSVRLVEMRTGIYNLLMRNYRSRHFATHGVLFTPNHRTENHIRWQLPSRHFRSVTEDFFPFWRSVPSQRPVILRMNVPEGTSLLDTWLKPMLLLQGIIFTIGSALTSVFAWVGYQRGKADLKLKQLQIREMEIRLENIELDRARAVRESTQSHIILLR